MTFDPVLTTQQFDILVHFANGGNYASGAEKFGLDPKILKNRVDEIRAELDADTITHAVTIAFCCDILTNRYITGFGTPVKACR